MEEAKFCQSCGMPLIGNEVLGTNIDGSANHEYCNYCFKNGAFTYNCTMEEMIATCAEYADKWEPPVTKDEAIVQMRQYFPTLKRWKNA